MSVLYEGEVDKLSPDELYLKQEQLQKLVCSALADRGRMGAKSLVLSKPVECTYHSISRWAHSLCVDILATADPVKADNSAG